MAPAGGGDGPLRRPRPRWLSLPESGERVSLRTTWPSAREPVEALLVLAHGAGAGMRHATLEALAAALAAERVASLRFQFPYMERGIRRPDSRARLLACVRAAIARGEELAARAGGLPLFAGGRSMGGRMTSLALAENDTLPVQGLVFFAFPLHPPRKPDEERAEHLQRVARPLLFLQGTRDPLAEPARMRRVCRRLGSRATLHEIPDADHSYHVPRRSGRSDAEVLRDIAKAAAVWMRSQ